MQIYVTKILKSVNGFLELSIGFIAIVLLLLFSAKINDEVYSIIKEYINVKIVACL